MLTSWMTQGLWVSLVGSKCQEKKTSIFFSSLCIWHLVPDIVSHRNYLSAKFQLVYFCFCGCWNFSLLQKHRVFGPEANQPRTILNLSMSINLYWLGVLFIWLLNNIYCLLSFLFSAQWEWEQTFYQFFSSCGGFNTIN